jgi:hypothetical protein
MGLDQGIRKLTPELAAKIIKRQELEWGEMDDEQREKWELTHEEYASMEQLWTGRKENHIHRAIEEITGQAVENCDYLLLTKRHIELLVSKLNGVSGDHGRAAELLPTQEGFFFGNTSYGEYYFRYIEEELEAFENILEAWDESAEYAYWAWW